MLPPPTKVDVHTPYQDHMVSMYTIESADRRTSSALTPGTVYRVFCYAEDIWAELAEDTVTHSHSPNYVSGATVNVVTFAHAVEYACQDAQKAEDVCKTSGSPGEAAMRRSGERYGR